jgi:hypothetical protein
MTTAEAHRLPDSVRADGRSASHAARTRYVAASGTLLVLAVFSAFVVTIGDSARSLGAGIAAEAWAFSGMSLGLAAALGSIGQAFPAGAARTRATGIWGPRSGRGRPLSANNTARYLGGAAGIALVVTIASAAGADGLVEGWDQAALVSAGLCALGAVIVASCRKWRR